LIQTLPNIIETKKQVQDMSDKYTKNKIYDNSFPGDATCSCAATVKYRGQNCHSQTDQGVTENDASNQDKLVERKRVYLHSIGRFSNLKKLQMSAYGD
jgi:hypothetical protein